MSEKCNWCNREISTIASQIIRDPIYKKIAVKGTKERQTSNQVVGYTTTESITCFNCVKHFKEAFREIQEKN